MAKRAGVFEAVATGESYVLSPHFSIGGVDELGQRSDFRG